MPNVEQAHRHARSEGEAAWVATEISRAEIARRTSVSDGGRVVRELVGPGCTIGTLRQRLIAATKMHELDIGDVTQLALAESWLRGSLLILPTPRSARLPAPRHGQARGPLDRGTKGASTSRHTQPVVLSKKEGKTIAQARRCAEAFLNEPLTVHVRRALRNGVTPAGIVRGVAERSHGWARLTERQVLWLAEQPDPDRWVRPAIPGRRDPDERSNAGGFWDSIRNERYVRQVGGGLPTLGKRR